MKSPLSRLCFAAVLAAAACRHAPPALTPPISEEPAPPPLYTPPPFEPLPLPRLKNYCLGYAMSASQLMPMDASPEKQREVAFENYYGAFLNVKEQTKYIACLEEDGSPEALKSRDQAKRWLAGAQEALDANMKYFPEAQRIVDAVESYSDVDEKKGRRRVIVTFRDGTKRTIDRFFDRLPSKP